MTQIARQVRRTMLQPVRICLFVVASLSVALAAPAFAKSPAGRFVTDVAAGTVHDNWWKLTWQRQKSPTMHTWSATSAPGSAQAYCAGLSLAGGGWRLPTITELASLMDRAESGEKLDPTAFAGEIGGYYTSSTPQVASTSLVWTIDFTSGWTFGYDMDGATSVRCVR